MEFGDPLPDGIPSSPFLLDLLKSPSISNYSCIVLFILDYIDTLPNEIIYVWRQSRDTTKVALIFTRYFGLASQVACCIFAIARLHYAPVPHAFCKGWHSLRIISYWIVSSFSNMAVIWRVYDMYDRSLAVAGLLFALFAMETSVTGAAIVRCLAVVKYDALCNGSGIPPVVYVFLASVLINQGTVWSLMLRKTEGWSYSRTLTELITKDGAWFWIAICGVLAMIVPASFVYQVGVSHLIFSWLVTFHSIGISRMLLSQEQCRHKRFKEFFTNSRTASPRLGLSLEDPPVDEDGPSIMSPQETELTETAGSPSEESQNATEVRPPSTYASTTSSKYVSRHPRSLISNDDLSSWESEDSAGQRTANIELGSTHYSSSIGSMDLWMR
ncbi:hypothetical protein CPC08DRAFT_72723 [Agrocybe pediades]|nr:hypothetical protein CPC08DRAFT_72723 [Agrocybe pediades]